MMKSRGGLSLGPKIIEEFGIALITNGKKKRSLRFAKSKKKLVSFLSYFLPVSYRYQVTSTLSRDLL